MHDRHNKIRRKFLEQQKWHSGKRENRELIKLEKERVRKRGCKLEYGKWESKNTRSTQLGSGKWQVGVRNGKIGLTSEKRLRNVGRVEKSIMGPGGITCQKWATVVKGGKIECGKNQAW